MWGGSALLIFIVTQIIFGDRSSKYNVQRERLMISTVYKGEFQEYIPVTGTVLPIQTRYLSAQEGGMVDAIYIESGTAVKKGDKILKLENTNLLMDIMWRESEMYDAENRLRTTRLQMEQNTLSLRWQAVDIEYTIGVKKRAFERAEALVKKEMISREEHELARDEYNYQLKCHRLILENQERDSLFRKIQIDQLESSLTRMKSNLELVKQKQDNLTIIAPLDGHLTSLIPEIGEMIIVGKRIGQIDVMDAFRVRARIDENYINRVEKGRHGKFTFDNQTYQLVITRVFLEVEEGWFEADLEFSDCQPEGIRRGQTLHIRLELSDLEEAVLLPKGGYYQTTGGQWVYILDETESFAVKRRVSLGLQNPEVYTVLEGLKPGDKIITSSYETFGDHDKLIITD